jgi:hypothetical protein
VLNALKSAELTVAEDELMEIGNDRRLQLKRPSKHMAFFWLSLWCDYSIITKKAFLCIVSLL